jgi:hypothetical protein
VPTPIDEETSTAPLSQAEEAILAKYRDTLRQLLGRQEALLAAYRGSRTEIRQAA